MHKGEGLTGGELIHKLWTNASHINVMKDFFEKVWTDSKSAKSEIEAIESQAAI